MTGIPSLGTRIISHASLPHPSLSLLRCHRHTHTPTLTLSRSSSNPYPYILPPAAAEPVLENLGAGNACEVCFCCSSSFPSSSCFFFFSGFFPLAFLSLPLVPRISRPFPLVLLFLLLPVLLSFLVLFFLARPFYLLSRPPRPKNMISILSPSLSLNLHLSLNPSAPSHQKNPTNHLSPHTSKEKAAAVHACGAA